jgi:hypothetical protein
LLNRKGCTPVTITAATDARLLKTNNPHGSVTKIARVNGMIGWDFSNSVNNQRAREGQVKLDFKAEKRAWGNHAGPSLVEYDGNFDSPFYVRLKVQRVLDVRYVRDADGAFLTREDVALWLPKKKKKSKKQGTIKGIFPTDYNVSNLLTIKMDGFLMGVRHAA